MKIKRKYFRVSLVRVDLSETNRRLANLRILRGFPVDNRTPRWHSDRPHSYIVRDKLPLSFLSFPLPSATVNSIVGNISGLIRFKKCDDAKRSCAADHHRDASRRRPDEKNHFANFS